MDGNDTLDGLTWSQAIQDIQTALDLCIAGDEVWVKEGTIMVTTSIKVDIGVTLFGSFIGSEDNPSSRDYKHITVLDGGNVTNQIVLLSD